MESGTQLESEHLHVPLGKKTAVGRKFIGFRQFHYPLFQGSDLGIHGIDHLKHTVSFGTLHTDSANGGRMTQATCSQNVLWVRSWAVFSRCIYITSSAHRSGSQLLLFCQVNLTPL